MEFTILNGINIRCAIAIHNLLFINNISSYMDEDKKQIIKESSYAYGDALEVSAFLIETEGLKDS